MNEEILDLVDKDNCVIDCMPRTEVFSKKLKNFRVVCVIVKNHQGQLFIPRRALHKIDFGGALACVGGCVSSGESYEQAFKREVQEEIAVNIDHQVYKLLGYISPYEYTVNGYIAAYELLVNDSVINFCQNDFSEGCWHYPEDLKKVLQNGEKATVNLSMILQLYYFNV